MQSEEEEEEEENFIKPEDVLVCLCPHTMYVVCVLMLLNLS
jgi:hypothetical protein